ncbi:MAG TPA: cell division protein FtsB [Deinococcales bacterium]|nr:cell division protein FtsB [Deinococcales bacterium]
MRLALPSRPSRAPAGARAWRLPSLARLRRDAGWLALSVIATVGIIQVTWLLAQGAYREVTWRADARAVNARVYDLQLKVAAEVERARAAASEPSYLEALARRLGYVRKGERVLVPLPDGAPRE